LIKGLGANISPTPANEVFRKENLSSAKGTAKAKSVAGEGSDFADQLLGGSSKELKGRDSTSLQNRNERTSESKQSPKNPGREVSTTATREGTRSIERETEDDQKVRAKERRPSDLDLYEQQPLQPMAQQAPVPSFEDAYIVETEGSELTEAPAEVSAASVSEKGAAANAMRGATLRGQDVRLPDFYSKAALMDGAAAAGPIRTTSVIEGGRSADVMVALQKEEQVSRQVAMKDFLQTMQTELGVPPEKVMQSFASLSDATLQSAPERSVQSFVENLQLDPNQTTRAESLYKDLIDKTGNSILSEKLVGMEEGVNFEVLSPRDVRKQELDSTLNSMNNTFFRKENLGDPLKAQKAADSMDAQIAQLMQEGRAQKPQENSPDGALMLDEPSFDDSLETDEFSDDSLDAGFEESSISGMSFDGGPVSAETLEGKNSNSSGHGSNSNSHQGASKTPDVNAIAPSIANEIKAADEASVDSNGEVDLSVSGSGQNAAPIAGMATTNSASAAVPAGAAAEMMMGRQPTAEDEQLNVRELIRQAQVVLKRGGGEMKMEMSPEGMGQVHLRVAVENGNVNVQMLTDNEAAKHLIEKGLGDLKASLASHQLQVDNMRVDVGSDIQKHMDQQASQEQARQQARQFAQDFMGSFRDERQSFRDGLVDQGMAMRSYKRPQREVSMGPQRASAGASSRRLNVVA